jgi:hypothetical protein
MCKLMELYRLLKSAANYDSWRTWRGEKQLQRFRCACNSVKPALQPCDRPTLQNHGAINCITKTTKYDL